MDQATRIDDVRFDEADAKLLFDKEDATTTNIEEDTSDEVVEAQAVEDGETVEASADEEAESEEEEVEEPVFTLDEEEYTKEQLLDAIKDSTNRKEWQTKNTQKAQEVSNDRKAIEPLVQLISRVKGNDEFKNVLGDAIEDELGEEARKEFDNAMEFDAEKSINPYKDELDKVRTELEGIRAEKAIEEAKAELKSQYKLKKAEVNQVYEHALDVYEQTGRILTLEEAYKQTPIYEDRIKQKVLKEAGLNKKPKPPKTTKKSRGATEINEKSQKITDYEQINAEGWGLFE